MGNSGEAAVLRRSAKEEGLGICSWLGLGPTDMPVGQAGGNGGDGLIPGAQATSYLQPCFSAQATMTSTLPLKSCPDVQQHALLAWASLLTHGLVWKELPLKTRGSNPLPSLVSNSWWLVYYIESSSSLPFCWKKTKQNKTLGHPLIIFFPSRISVVISVLWDVLRLVSWASVWCVSVCPW